MEYGFFKFYTFKELILSPGEMEGICAWPGQQNRCTAEIHAFWFQLFYQLSGARVEGYSYAAGLPPFFFSRLSCIWCACICLLKGVHWDVPGCRAVAFLRCFLLSGLWQCT